MQQFKPYFLRTKEPPSQPRRQRSAVPARRRQGHRPRRGRAHRAPLLLLRDARQLLVRRLLQGRGGRLRLGVRHPGDGARAGAALGDRARGRPGARAGRGRRRDRGLAARRHPARADRPARQGQLLAGRPRRGRAGSARRSSTTAASATPAATRRAGRGTATGTWRSTTSCSWSTTCGPATCLRASRARTSTRASASSARCACVQERRLGVRHRRLPRDHGLDRRAVRSRLPRQRGLAARAPRARRPRPRRHLPDRRGHAAVERGSRLHLPPPAAPRDPAGAAHRPRRPSTGCPPSWSSRWATRTRCCASTPAEIERVVRDEEERFSETLARGMKVFDAPRRHADAIAADDAFKLAATFGFPIELTQELAEERGQPVDVDGFRDADGGASRDLARRRREDRRCSAPRSSPGPAGFQTEFVGYAKTDVLTADRGARAARERRRSLQARASPVLRRERWPGHATRAS